MAPSTPEPAWEPRPIYTQTEVDRYYTSIAVLAAYAETFPHHRWHSNLRCSYLGSLDMEIHVAELAGLGADGPDPAGRGSIKTVLDFGCGAGAAVCDFARRFGVRARGLNISEDQLAIGREIACRDALTDLVTLDTYDGYRFPYEDDTFDAVTYFESPVAVPHKRELFREIHRVLKPGGRMCGDDWILTERVTPEIYRASIEPICHAYAVPAIVSIAHYRRYMEDAGLAVLEARDLQTRSPDFLSYSFLTTPERRRQARRRIDEIGRKMGDRELSRAGLEDPAVFRSLLPALDREQHAASIGELMMLAGGVHLGRAAERGEFSLGLFLAEKRRSHESPAG